jgi:hypothetical protein
MVRLLASSLEVFQIRDRVQAPLGISFDGPNLRPPAMAQPVVLAAAPILLPAAADHAHPRFANEFVHGFLSWPVHPAEW